MFTIFWRTILALYVVWLPMSAAAFTVPLPDGFVRDDAGILTVEEEQELESIVSTLQVETSQEIGILIVQTVQGESISDVAYEVFTKWGIGQKETNNGLLMLIAVQDKNIWITTGRGLEGVLPDILVKKIIDTEVFPSFKTGAYATGIKSGILAIQKVTAGEYTPIQSNSSQGAFFIVLLFFCIIASCIFLIVYATRATGLRAKKIVDAQFKEHSNTGPMYTHKESFRPNSYTVFKTNNATIFAQHTSKKVSNTFAAIATTPPLIAPSLFKQRYLRILDIFIIIILVAKTERQARLFSLFFLYILLLSYLQVLPR